MIKNLIGALLLTISFMASSQLALNPKEMPLNIGLYGDNLIHPGLKIGTNYVFHTKEKTKIRKFKGLERKWGSKLKTINYSVDANLGFYNHVNNNFGTFIGIGASRIRTKARKNWVSGMSLEINYLRRFFNIPTYILNDNNEIERKRFAGTNAVMFAFAPMFGRNIMMDKDFGGLRIYVKPSLQLLKYNHAFFPNFSFEIGCTINFKK